MKREKVTLNNIGNGAAKELFDYELQRVLENIEDSNTDPTKVREITMKFKMKPSADREVIITEILAVSKLVPDVPFSLTMYPQKEKGGDLVAYQKDPNQYELDDIKDEKILKMKEK